jgi:hypothetical protein
VVPASLAAADDRVLGLGALLWARTPSTNPDPDFLSAFETMLHSVQFRSA